MTNLYLMRLHHHRNEWIPSPQSISKPPISRNKITLKVLIGAVVYLCLIGNRQSSNFDSNQEETRTLTGQPAQVQLEPQPQEPEEAQPQPDMVMVV